MSTGRRDYDNTEALEQRLLRAIERQASDNRHILRNEFAEAIVVFRKDLASIHQDVQVGNLAQVTETARIQASIEELKSTVAELKTLEPRVEHLEQSQRTDEAVEEALNAARQAAERNRITARNWDLGIIMAVIAAAGVLVAFLH
jgi:hypothetical protein